MRSVTTVGMVSGPLVLLAYLLGSATRWRNPFRDGAAATTGSDGGHLAPRTQLVVDVGLVVVAYLIAEQVTRAVAPGTTFSRVASLSSQVLFVWDSLALWCALAAILGSIAPPWTSFRDGGDGLAAAAVLVAFRAPLVGLGALLVGAAALVVLGTPRRAVPAALGGAVVGAWLLWIVDVWPPWGVPNGPELTLWTTATAGVLFARWVQAGARGQ